MTPRRTLEEVAGHCWFIGGACRSGGALEYVLAGREIPEWLLPGRLVAAMQPRTREALRALTSADAANVAPWHVRALVEMTPRPR